MEYLFDTNIFVESKKNLPMDIWPTFWTKMIGLIKSGNIHSIDKVKDEIDKGGDELTNWIHKNAPRGFFLKQDASVMAKNGRNDCLGSKQSCRILSICYI